MLDTFISGIARGFGAFGWCIAFIGGWSAIAVIFAVVSAILRHVTGADRDDED